MAAGSAARRPLGEPTHPKWSSGWPSKDWSFSRSTIGSPGPASPVGRRSWPIFAKPFDGCAGMATNSASIPAGSRSWASRPAPHLAALLGTQPEERGPDGVSSRVQAVVSFYGPSDLASSDELHAAFPTNPCAPSWVTDHRGRRISWRKRHRSATSRMTIRHFSCFMARTTAGCHWISRSGWLPHWRSPAFRTA